MSHTTQVNVLDKASPEVRAKISGFGRPLNTVMGRAVSNCIRSNYVRWNSANPNKLGGERTNLGAQFARATHPELLADGFAVVTSHVAARQRLMGGTIRPVKAKMLAIPADAEAYGKRPREFNNLRFAVLGGHPALVVAEATQVKSTKKGFKAVASSLGNKVMYWLANSINQVADPSVLPSEAEMVDAATSAALSTIDRTNSRNQGRSE